MKRLFDFVLRRHQPDIDALSTQVDGRLGGAAAEALASHLETCGVCRARLEELRGVRDRLRAMRAAEAPRSFRLTRAMVDAAPARRPQPAVVRWAPALGGTAAVVFAVLAAVDVSSSGGGTGAMSLARQAAEAPPAAQQAGTPAAAGAATPEAIGADARAATADENAQLPAPAAPSGTPAVADSGSASVPTPSGNSALSSEQKAANERGGGTSNGRFALRVVEALVAAVAIGAAGLVIGRRLGRGASR